MRVKQIIPLNLFLYCVLFANWESSNEILYIFPPPDALYVSKQTSVILKFAHPVENPETVKLTCEGEASGFHAGDVLFSDDKKTMIFKSYAEFTAGESVRVTLEYDREYSFSFFIAASPVRLENFYGHQLPNKWALYGSDTSIPVDGMQTMGDVVVPSDFPQIITRQKGFTARGRIFFASTYTDLGNYLIICENDGTPYFYRRYERNELGSADFKVQPTGDLSAFLFKYEHFIVLDKQFNETATYKCSHGYQTDFHDFYLLPNGQALLLAVDPQTMDLNKVIPGGRTDATVLGHHIQLVDQDGNVFFEWRSWDHFNIADAKFEDLTQDLVDYVHINSIAVDYDGHYIISSRHLSEVSKINKDTGEFIWRLGGVNNQFTMLNDPYELSYQHYAMPVPDKPDYYTIFDNGNYRRPGFTRAVEYMLDPEKKTAKKVWECSDFTDRICQSMGCVQRLHNDNSFLDFSPIPPLRACEVTYEGDVVFDMEVAGTTSYRTRRYEWEGKLEAPYLIAEAHQTKVLLIYNKFGDEDVVKYVIYAGTNPDSLQKIATRVEHYYALSDLRNKTEYYFKVQAIDAGGQISPFSNTGCITTNFVNPGSNMIRNGDFSGGTEEWNLNVVSGGIATGSIDAFGQYKIRIYNGGTQKTAVQLFQEGIELLYGKTYRFEFDAFASFERTIEAKIEMIHYPYTNYGRIGTTLLKTGKQRYVYELDMKKPSDYNARVVFNCGLEGPDVYIDNIVVRQTLSDFVTSFTQAVNNFSLDQNFPNPFNAVSKINYRIPATGFVKLIVFDTLGREVITLVSENQDAGFHSVVFNAADIPSGVYFYRLVTLNFNQVRKMVCIK
ncbi:aryl-sulfate sulfotransferase [candidate division KSB1 bacterium]|nr:aryl-sulfate sulfotransferase [candidate division KSB1 bacterium]